MDDEVRKQIFEEFKEMITTESVVGEPIHPVSYTHLRYPSREKRKRKRMIMKTRVWKRKKSGR